MWSRFKSTAPVPPHLLKVEKIRGKMGMRPLGPIKTRKEKKFKILK